MSIIIAEAGVNHNGSQDMAFKLVDAAVEAGADAVKFQTFKAESLVTKDAAKAEYQKKTTSAEESQYLMLKRLELSHEVHRELFQYCVSKNIQFLSTAFDLESLYFLVGDLGVETLKIPSGEITNAPLLLAHAQTGKNLIVSTGMTTLDEIEDALGVIAFGLTKKTSPSKSAFKVAYQSEYGQESLRKKVTLLHCTTEYPAPPEDINLRAMQSMQDKFSLKIGYSDHSKGIAIPIAATAMGAVLIEKHFTLDKSLPGPDHKASLVPGELKLMVDSIRIVEKALGDGNKIPQPSELKNRDIVRKSLVAAENIKQGEVFTEDNVALKRPGTGKSPMDYWDLLGSESKRTYQAEDILV